jgi:hypothetical protein
LLRADSDDIEYDESEEIDAGMAFDDVAEDEPETEVKTAEATTDVAQETVEMKNEPIIIITDKAADAAKAAEERGTLSYLKSVEGRVLTIMEAAIPNDQQRDAIKTLIKKEFRREMTKANRGSFASDED